MNDVLDDDDGGIDDDAEINRAHRNQVGGNVLVIQKHERTEQCERDHRSDNESRPPVAQTQESHEHRQDQQDALGHVVADRVERAVDQFRAVVVRHQPYARRQVVFVDLIRLGLDELEHLQRVRTPA